MVHNGKTLGLSGYRQMLESDFRQIPDLRFTEEVLVVDPPDLACRLSFHCSPSGTFLGLPIMGRTVHFTENVFYRFDGRRIARSGR